MAKGLDIPALALQAGFSQTYELERLHNFAILLIQQCAEVCNSDSISSPYYQNKILQHFGLQPKPHSTPKGWV